MGIKNYHIKEKLRNNFRGFFFLASPEFDTGISLPMFIFEVIGKLLTVL